ncbi:heme peroxidase [Powellomyces hirtus]|nr:heme peroxidase [Powellomyces hirtus]
MARILVFLFLIGAAGAARHLNGKENNAAHPDWGSYGETLGRAHGPARYVDGVSQPIGTGNSSFPSARFVSNVVMGSKGSDIPNTERISHMLAFWGQFMAHDMIHVENNASERFDIPIPAGDPVYDPGASGQVTMKFTRIKHAIDPITNERQFHNHQTGWIDASQVYGAEEDRLVMLRTFSGGLMRTYKNNLLPLRPENTPDIMLGLKPRTFLSGDLRANENPALLSIQTLFLREHNRRAAHYAKLHPNATDEDLFQMTRMWVIACVQKITYTEYLPRLLGQQLPPYKGYNASVDPAIDVLFIAASFRYGHSAISSIIPRLDDKWAPHPKGHLILRDAITNPTSVLEDGIEPILRGLVTQLEQSSDVVLVDDLRNFMPGPPFGLSPQLFFDLAAFNIQRGRDFGLPSYNECRKSFGIPKVYAFADITSDETLQKALFDGYNGNIEDIEPYVGGLAEDVSNGLLGPLFKASITDQFTRLRDGDAYWYEIPGVLNTRDFEDLGNVSLSQIILWNTNIVAFPESSFTYADASQVDKLRGVSSSTSGGTTSIQGSIPQIVQLTTGLLLQYHIDVESSTVEFVLASNYSGWFAFGLGNSMAGADIYAVYEDGDGTWTVHDLHATAQAQPPTDVSQGCTNDITDVTDVSEAWYSTRAFSFSRKLNTGDACDREISASSATLPIIFAYSTDAVNLAYHGSKRFQSTLNFYSGVGSSGTSGVSIVTSSSKSLTLYFLVWHAVDMMFLLFFIIPIGIYVARYGKRVDLWLFWHKLCMGVAIGEFAFTVRYTIMEFEHFKSQIQAYDHIKLGIATATFGLVIGSAGYLAQMDWKVLARYSQGLRLFHKIGSYTLYFAAIFNGWLGVQDLAARYGSTSKVWPMLYMLYFAVLAIILLGVNSLNVYLAKFVQRLVAVLTKSWLGKWMDKNYNDDPAAVVQLTESVQVKVPGQEMTLEAFENSCVDGRSWTIVGGLIVDLSGYMDQHPGGRRLLEDYVGMDATSAFMGHLKNGHRHSRFAMNKLSTFVIASLPKAEVSDVGRSILSLTSQRPRRRSVTSGIAREPFKDLSFNESGLRTRRGSKQAGGLKIIATSQMTPLPPTSPLLTQASEKKGQSTKSVLQPPSVFVSSIISSTEPSQLDRATLVEKTTVTAFHAARPVRRFRFRFPEATPVDIEPGDGVTLRLEDQSGTTHVREYTPIQCSVNDCIDLYIKIYPAGRVTAPLDELVIGDTVEMSTPRSHVSLTNPNSEDGCYPNVVMIAAGTGITPMLQMLTFYVENCTRRTQGSGPRSTQASRAPLASNMRLMWANRSEEEMFLAAELRSMELSCGGSLRISHILSTPTPTWTGPTGRVTQQQVKDMLPDDLRLLLREPPVAPPGQDEDLEGGGGSLGITGAMLTYDWDTISILICGPPGFNTTVVDILNGLSIPDRIVNVL